MRNFSEIDFGDIWISVLICLVLALPLTGVLWVNGFGFLNSIIFGISTGLFAGLSFLSDEYKCLRVICALILAAAAVILSHQAEFSKVVSISVVTAAAILGYFARKWIEIIWYVS